MGGHAGGDIASSTILGALVGLDGESYSGAGATNALLKRITAANAELGRLVQEDPDLDGMGTTLIAILRARDKLVLARIVPLGERHFRRALQEFVDHYHRERNHQGLENRLIESRALGRREGGIRRRPRLRGLLNYYERAA